MLYDIRLMGVLIKIENVLETDKDQNEVHPYASVFLEIDDEIRSECLHMVGLTDENLYSVEELGKIDKREIMINLKEKLLARILESETFKTKLLGIKEFFQLDESENRFLHLLYLLNECPKMIYFDPLLNSKHSHANLLADSIGKFFKIDSILINDYFFNIKSSFNKFRIFSYDSAQTLICFPLRNYFLSNTQLTFQDYILSLNNFKLKRLDLPLRGVDLNKLINTMRENSNYKVELKINSDLFAYQYADEISKNLNLKCIPIQICSLQTGMQMDMVNFLFTRLKYLPLEDCILFISVDASITNYENGDKIIRSLISIMKDAKNRMIFRLSAVECFSKFLIPWMQLIDMGIDLSKSDRSLRDIIYKSIVGTNYTDEAMARVELSHGALEEVMRLKLTSSELSNHIKYLAHKESIPVIHEINHKIDYSYFSTNISPEKIKEAVSRFKFLKQSSLNKIDKISFLFSGPPGTGKSLLAETICVEIGLNFKKVRFSDLTSMWVHDTENKMRDFFEQNKNYEVLIFDEIDSLLLKREGATRQHEVSEVNEFLNCMDHFKGIIFATTNYPDIIDGAGLRRFDFKVKFDYLSSERAISMFNSFFENYYLSEEEKNVVTKKLSCSKSLTPAVFSNIYRQSLLMDNYDIPTILNQIDTQVNISKTSIRLIGRSSQKDQ